MIFGMIVITMVLFALVADKVTLSTKTINSFACDTVVLDEITSFKALQYKKECHRVALEVCAIATNKGIEKAECKRVVRETLTIAKEMTMKTKLFNAARLTGKLVEFAAIKAAYVTMPRRQLKLELGRVEKELIALANKGRSIPAAAHDLAVAKRNIIRECLDAC